MCLDNTIFFSRASLEDLETLKIIWVVFGHMSRLKVNLEKSTLFGINVDLDQLDRLVVALDCGVSDWPIPYFGLPLEWNPKVGAFPDLVIERVLRRLDGWKKTYLSLGGRITLLHLCLSHIPNYFLPLFKIISLVVLKIEKLQKGFSMARI